MGNLACRYWATVVVVESPYVSGENLRARTRITSSSDGRAGRTSSSLAGHGSSRWCWSFCEDPSLSSSGPCLWTRWNSWSRRCPWSNRGGPWHTSGRCRPLGGLVLGRGRRGLGGPEADQQEETGHADGN